MPRVLALNPDSLKAITTAVSTGATIEDAALAASIARQTLNKWLKRGRDATAGAEVAPEDALFVELLEGVETARALAKTEALNIVRRAALGIPVKETRTTTKTNRKGETETTVVVVERIEVRWQAAAWFLERRYPHEFALRNRLEITGEGGGPVDIEDRAARIAREASAFLQGRTDALAEAGTAEPPE